MIINYKKLTPEQQDTIKHIRDIYCIDDIVDSKVKKKADNLANSFLYNKNEKEHNLLTNIFVDHYIDNFRPSLRKEVSNYLYNDVIFNNKRLENAETIFKIFDGRVNHEMSNEEKIKIFEKTYSNLLKNHYADKLCNNKISPETVDIVTN